MLLGTSERCAWEQRREASVVATEGLSVVVDLVCTCLDSHGKKFVAAFPLEVSRLGRWGRVSKWCM